jgi:hypothetical protein
MADKYVYSTLASDQRYNFFPSKASAGGVSVPTVSILVRGGAGVAGDWRRLETPRGIATRVTDEEAAMLKGHPVFKVHEANGYVCIEEGAFEVDDVAATMSETDPSRPLTEETIKAVVPEATVVSNAPTKHSIDDVPPLPTTKKGGK